MVQLIGPLDAVWLLAESEHNRTHVAGVQVFRPPSDAPPDLLDRLYLEMTDTARLKPRFRLRAYRSWRTGGQYAWQADEDVDLTRHVVRVSLAAPGDDRALLEHVSNFHTEPLDRSRPLWQACLIEGLVDGRFALCTKVHHALFDGVSTCRQLVGGLSSDPASQDCAAPWLRPLWQPKQARRSSSSTAMRGPVDALAVPSAAARSAAAMAKAIAARLAAGGDGMPYTAPTTPFNGPVGAARRFVAGSWSIERLRAVARAGEASSNDVLLAMCGGGLRRYLDEVDALPHTQLVAMVPVSRRARGAGAQEGNDVGAVLCPLATDQADPAERLARVHAVMGQNKALMGELDSVSAAAVSAAVLGPVLAAGALPVPLLPRPPFNLVISNVPGSSERLYLNGCELTEMYPLSVVSRGQGLNITVMSYAGRLGFGITACGTSMPRLERLVGHLDAALVELETAYELTDHHVPTQRSERNAL